MSRSKIKAIILASAALAALAVGGFGCKEQRKEAVRTHTVLIEGMAFSPATVHLRRGDRVLFKNTDLVPHTATAKSPATLDSGAIKPGESWTTPPLSGDKIHYVCTFHPMMAGQIAIEAR